MGWKGLLKSPSATTHSSRGNHKAEQVTQGLVWLFFFLSLVICKDRDATTSSSPVPLLLHVLSLATPEKVVSFCVSVELSASGLETEPCLLYMLDQPASPKLRRG